ncbi:hypothetical protein D3C71_1711190 [compost metagenome]
MMPKADTIELDMTVDAALKYIVSMGVVAPTELPRKPGTPGRSADAAEAADTAEAAVAVADSNPTH